MTKRSAREVRENQSWSGIDSLSDGRRFRMLCVVDDCTRECLGLVADTSLSGLRVVRELDAIVAVRGLPLTVVSDNGTELTSTAILRWSQERGIRPVTAPWREPWLAGDLSDARTSVGKVRSGFLDGDHHRG